MAGATPDPAAWIDLQAVLKEELDCIRGVELSPEAKTRSAAESLERAGLGQSPDPAIRLKAVPGRAFYKALFKENLWGLCLSGGGIRSATFALGFIQGLAKTGLLPRFHYLSTVSGGGYIGSWLSSWATRHPHGIEGVTRELNAPPLGKRIEADPVWYLRSYTSYLNPKLGVLSADTWTLIATYLRNLLLNWLVLIPLFWVIALMPKIGLALVRLLPGDPVTDIIAQHRAGASLVALLIGCAGLALGMTYIFSALVEKLSGTTDVPETAKSRTQAEFLLRGLIPVMVAVFCLPLAWAWYPGAAPAWWAVAAAGVLLRLIASALSFGLAWLGDRLEKKRLPDILWIVAFSLATGALGGAFAWLLATRLFADVPGAIGGLPDATTAAMTFAVIKFVCFAPPLLLMSMLATEAVFVGLISRRTDDEDREWWGRAGGWLFIASVIWMGLRILTLFGPLTIHWLEAQAPVFITAAGGLSGILTAALGFGASTPAAPGRHAPKTLGSMLRASVLSISTALFICAMFAVLSLASDTLLHRLANPDVKYALDCTDTDWGLWITWCVAPAAALAQSIGLLTVIAAMIALGALAAVMQYFVSVNRFSLHALYRARLIRAYLGASRSTADPQKPVLDPKFGPRKPNWFTGFDPNDNINMADLDAGLCEAPSPGEGTIRKNRYPFHLLNTALNLVHGDELAWQQRMAASMTISPLHCGNRDLGYRRSATYGHPEGISLGTALTISGAAASPNMGYHSSPIVGAVMTLFNVRLGAWLGNPARPVGDRSSSTEGPRFSAKYFAYETMGLTNRRRPYVYLSDGGHFENLGLYELVQRRCRLIVVSDAGCDPGFEFEDLGNAIRKIRIDFGVDIEMDAMEMHPRADADADGVEPVRPGRYFATGTIVYPEGKKGRLIYVKPGIYGSEPRDVLNYAATHPDFPHESTSDQWFDESQFESYRRLGRHVAKRIFGTLHADASIEGVMEAVRRAAMRDGSVGEKPPGWTPPPGETRTAGRVAHIVRRGNLQPRRRWAGWRRR